jgi:ACDE family multidrug resistance protein
VLATGHKLVGAAERGTVEGEAISPTLEPVGTAPTGRSRPVIVAVGATEDAAETVDAAAAIARDTGSALEVVHVRETAVVEEQAIDAEDDAHARSAVLGHLDRLATHGITATGQVLHSVGDHATAGRVLAQHAEDVDARTVAIGRSPRGPVAQFADGSLTTALTHAAACTVVLLEPGRSPYELTAQSLDRLRSRSA